MSQRPGSGPNWKRQEMPAFIISGDRPSRRKVTGWPPTHKLCEGSSLVTVSWCSSMESSSSVNCWPLVETATVARGADLSPSAGERHTTTSCLGS